MDDCEEMRDIIELYKNMPELWNVKSDHYKNKNIRSRSYGKLLTEYKKIKSDASVDDLKKKIANMRTCYRRELKKNLHTQRSGAGTDDIYESTLWYYDSFHFLRDLEIPMPGRSNFSSEEDDEIPAVKPHYKKKFKKTSVDEVRNQLLKKATEHLGSSKVKEAQDDADVFGTGWSCMLRQMTPEQQLFAKQAVDEIMLLGRLNKLHLNYLHSSSVSSNLFEATTPYSSSVSSPHTVNVPLISPAVSVDDSVQVVSECQYSTLHDLFQNSQFQ